MKSALECKSPIKEVAGHRGSGLAAFHMEATLICESFTITRN